VNIIEKRFQQLGDKQSASLFAQELIGNTRQVTKAKRNFLKKQENDEQSKVYAKMFGKMGHATCVILRIGDYIPSKSLPLDIPLSMSAEAMQRVERKKLLKQSAFQKFQPTVLPKKEETTEDF